MQYDASSVKRAKTPDTYKKITYYNFMVKSFKTKKGKLTLSAHETEVTESLSSDKSQSFVTCDKVNTLGEIKVY